LIFAVQHFYPREGGAEKQARRLAAYFKQRGVHATILTGRYAGQPRDEAIDGVPVYRHFIGVDVPVVHEFFYLLSLAWQLLLRRREYDIVQLFQLHLEALVAVAVAKLLRKRVIVRVSCAGQYGEIAFWRSFPGGRWLLSAIRRNVDAVVAVSTDIQAELQQQGFTNEKVFYIPNGVFPAGEPRPDKSGARARLGFSQDKFIAVFVGRLTPQKAPGLLLEAWEKIMHLHEDAMLVFVGAGEQRDLLARKLAGSPLQAAVKLVGYVENVPDYLAAADLFVLPSHTEGFSNALLEAMAAGLPIVASRVSGTADAIQHGEDGLLFAAGDVGELTHSLAAMIASQDLRDRLGTNARQTVQQRFTLDAVAQKYLHLYRSVSKA
jgi:glycosyltransferase involved in cell wall biosynthesis